MQSVVMGWVIFYYINQTAAPAPSISSWSTSSPTVFFTSFTAFCSPSMKNTRSPPVEFYPQMLSAFHMLLSLFDNRQQRTSFVSKLSPTHQVWCCCSPTLPPFWLRHDFPSQRQRDWTLGFSLVRFQHNKNYDRWCKWFKYASSSPEANMIN